MASLVLSYIGIKISLPNPNGLNVNLLRASGGKINGISIGLGKGYGAKGRFDMHPIPYPNAKSGSISLPKSVRENLPVPHYHRRGPGGGLRRHRPWETRPSDGKGLDKFLNRF